MQDNAVLSSLIKQIIEVQDLFQDETQMRKKFMRLKARLRNIGEKQLLLSIAVLGYKVCWSTRFIRPRKTQEKFARGKTEVTQEGLDEEDPDRTKSLFFMVSKFTCRN